MKECKQKIEGEIIKMYLFIVMKEQIVDIKRGKFPKNILQRKKLQKERIIQKKIRITSNTKIEQILDYIHEKIMVINVVNEKLLQ